MLGYRNDDAVLTICQNNAAKSITILDVNDVATGILGYSAADLKGKPLSVLLPVRMSTLMSEYVEYEEDANDVGAVLSKVQTVNLIAKDKKEKPLRLKVVRDESSKDKLTFRLVFQDSTELRKDDAIQRIIQENFKGHQVLHPVFGVPDRNSLKKDMEIVAHYHHKAQLRASLVVVQIDHFPSYQAQYSEDVCVEMVKHIVHVCRSNLRPSDILAVLDDTHIGVLLLESVSDATRMVANRLRWQVAAHPFKLPDTSGLSMSASMVYTNINGAVSADALINACLAALAPHADGAASQLQEVRV